MPMFDWTNFLDIADNFSIILPVYTVPNCNIDLMTAGFPITSVFKYQKKGQI